MKVKISNRFLKYITDWDYYIYFLLGSYGSGKSFNTAIKIVLKALKEKRKILIARKVFATLKDSCYADIKEAITFLGLDEYFHCGKSPMEITCKVSGSVILFKGLDDFNKIKSIKDIDLAWIEEADCKLEDHNEVLNRLRVLGKKCHLIITTNPKPKSHWIYKRYFSDRNVSELDLYKYKTLTFEDVYYHHSTYADNTFLNKNWIKNLLSEQDPLMRLVKIKGEFGSTGKKVYENIEVMKVDDWNKVNKFGFIRFRGLDFGFATSYNAYCDVHIDKVNNYLYISKEYYSRGILNSEIAKNIKLIIDDNRIPIIADSAEPKSIEELRRLGLNIRKSKKGAGSVKAGIKKVRAFTKVIIVDCCPNAIKEAELLEFKKNDRTGEYDESKLSIDAHLMLSALIYSIESYKHYDLKSKKLRRPIGM